jgi:hypothetical protein
MDFESKSFGTELSVVSRSSDFAAVDGAIDGFVLATFLGETYVRDLSQLGWTPTRIEVGRARERDGAAALPLPTPRTMLSNAIREPSC